MKRRENGTGSILYDPARKSYRAYISVDGKRIGKRFKTKSAALDWIITARNFKPSAGITLGEWAIEYLQTYSAPNVRPTTQERYLQTANLIAPISQYPLAKINALNVQRFYANIPSGNSKQKIHALLCRLFKKAVALELITKNPMLAVDRPTYTPKEIRIFSHKEIEALLSSLRQSRYYKRYYPLVYFALSTGARLSEILGLKSKNVHKGYVIINATLDHTRKTTAPPKTKAAVRKITITAETQLLLDTEKDFVFTSANGGPMSIHNFERAWRHILAEAGIEYKNFHALRHTHASRLLAVGVPVLEVAKRLGHTKASTTLALYGHAIQGYDALIPAKVNEAIFGHNFGTV